MRVLSSSVIDYCERWAFNLMLFNAILQKTNGKT
jgi:hypothetical protein